MKKISLKKIVLVILVISMLSLTSYATDSVRETKETVTTQQENGTSGKKSLQEIEAEMKAGIVGIGDSEDEGIFNKDKEESEEDLQEMGSEYTKLIVIRGGLILAIGIVIILLIRKVALMDKSNTKAPANKKANVQEVPYKQEHYEVYAKEDKEKFDKEYEKAEVSEYKNLEENDLIPEDDDFDMNNVGVAAPIEEEEENLSPEAKLDKFVKRIESKKEIQQKLFDDALSTREEEKEIEEEITPVVEEKEESLLGFDYEEVEEPIKEEESLLGFDYEEEKEEEVEEIEEVAPVVEEKQENLTSFSSRPTTANNTARKTNRFSYIEIPEEGAEEEKKEELRPTKIGFTRRGTKKVTPPAEETKKPEVEEKLVEEEKKEEISSSIGELDFFAEMEANMKKSKEEREKNKK